MTAVHGRLSIARRPALIGLAGLSALVGGVAVVRAAQNVWAVDAERNLAAAAALLHGTFGSVPDYLYSPLAAALTVPAQAIDWNPTDAHALPDAPVSGKGAQSIQLVPYGCTKFRISMFPVTSQAWGSQ